MQRDYKAPDFGVRDTRTVEQRDVAQADTRSTQPIKFGDETWGSRLIEQLGRQGSAALDKLADVEFGNLYLEGQAAAGQIESEAELEGNMLTRDWKVAGYRDTMGKLALADAEAQFSTDLLKLREQTPEQLQAYLSKRREKLLPGIAGMSAEARAAATGQLLLQDRAAIGQHTSEHTKFIIEQKSQAVQAQWHTTMRNLGSAQDRMRLGDLDPRQFGKQLELAAGTMVGTVWEDKSLPDDVKQQLTFEMVQSTLANNSVELYDYLAQNDIPDGAGGASSLLSRLGGKQQQQLANAYRDAHNRTSDARNQFQMEQVANIEAQLAANTFNGTYEDLKDVLDPLVARGVITGEKRMSMITKLNTERYKNDQQYILSDIAYRGATHEAFLLGKTETDLIEAVDKGLQDRGADPATRLMTYLSIGGNGLSSAFKKAGEALAPALQQMRSPDGTILPQHAETFVTINRALAKAKVGGNPNADVQLLSGLEERDRTFLTRVLAERDLGKSLEQAVATATTTEEREEKLTPSMRAAASAGMAKAVNEHIQSIEPMSMLGQAWTSAKAIIPWGDTGARAQAELGTRIESDQWFGESPTNGLYIADVAMATQDSAARILKTSPLTTKPEQVVLQAQADVASRTIQTRHGPLIVPHGANQATLFGVAPGNLNRVGPALDKMLQETKKDTRFHIKFDHAGRVVYQEYDKNGAPVGTGDSISPKAISRAIQEEMNNEEVRAMHRYGEGKPITKDGITLKVNGDNTAGAANEWMLAFRENLVQNEGVRDTEYEDQTGKKNKAGKTIKTLGVGVTSTNKHYPKVGPDGKVTPAEIRRSFHAASNAAAVAGSTAAKAADVHNKHGFMLMSELAYQSGTSFMRQENKTGKAYREFAGALKSKDVAAAQAAFKRTAAWYWSADRKKPNVVTERQKHYLKLIEQSIIGE